MRLDDISRLTINIELYFTICRYIVVMTTTGQCQNLKITMETLDFSRFKGLIIKILMLSFNEIHCDIDPVKITQNYNCLVK